MADVKTNTACPPTEELRGLLDGSLSGARQSACTSHLDACACCQAMLEQLATGSGNLSQIVRGANAAEPEATSAYWPALRALDNPSSSVSQTPPPLALPRDDSLSFLQPASDAAYLGRLAHFDVMRVLGRGGMGIVFEAFDSRLQRNVAVKVLSPELAGDEVARARFCREARAAASITHENVVAVHQVEKSGDHGLPYLVMQLIAGETLEQRLKREKKLPLREVVRIGMQAAYGLAAAHELGLIHRDIKPGNILLESSQDHVKLTDFGLARVAEDVKLTHTGHVAGTPLYMSPEQAMGEETDHRSDLFSLGAVLYEMCSGETPFGGNSALAILKQIADAKHRPLRTLNPDVPEWLADTIDSLLAKNPANRIQSAAHLAELFEFQWALIKSSSEEIPTLCEVEQRRIAVRNRVIATVLALASLAVGLIAGSMFARRGDSAGSVPAAVSSAEPRAVLSANAGAVWAVAFDPTSNVAAMSVEDGSVRLWDLPTKSIRTAFNAHRGVVWVLRFSPDGQQLITGGDDGLIKVWKTSQPEAIKSFEHSNAVRGLALARDGRTLFAGDRAGGLKQWSLDADEPIATAQQPGAIYAVALSPNDETLATAGSDKVVRLWNAQGLAQKLPLEGHTGPVYSLAFSPDGQRLASVGWDKQVHIWDASSGLLHKAWPGHDGDIWAVAYSPDGTKLATGGHDGAVKLWDAQSGELLATFLGHGLAVHAVAFNADGSLLASGGRDGAVRVWNVK